MKIDISSFLNNAKRVLTLSKKPTSEEFWTIAKVTGMGILVLGLIGYVMSSIKVILG